jgi:hypothetical protein
MRSSPSKPKIVRIPLYVKAQDRKRRVAGGNSSKKCLEAFGNHVPKFLVAAPAFRIDLRTFFANPCVPPYWLLSYL